MHSLCTILSTEFGERERRPGCRAAALNRVLVFPECPPIFENYLVSWKHGKNGENSEGFQLRLAVEFASLVVFFVICWGGGRQLSAPQKAIKTQKTTLKACSNLYSSFLH